MLHRRGAFVFQDWSHMSLRRMDTALHPKHYLLASDFDQTLSFNDSGILLSELLGIAGFAERCAGLS